jgi:hypothetical protein
LGAPFILLTVRKPDDGRLTSGDHNGLFLASDSHIVLQFSYHGSFFKASAQLEFERSDVGLPEFPLLAALEGGAHPLASSSSFRISNETNPGLPSLLVNETARVR